MCAEFVKEINTLLDMGKTSLADATRYSYLISQQVDLETEQVDTFESCVDAEVEKDPNAVCVEIMTRPGYFSLYSATAKGETCQSAVQAWNTVKSAGESAPKACAVLTSHMFQAYSWYLQDLQDGIIGTMTEKLSQQLEQASSDYDQHKEEMAVQLFLKKQADQQTIAEGQKLVNDI